MLQWETATKHVFYLNNLLAFLTICLYGFWIGRRVVHKHYDKIIHALSCSAIAVVLLFIFNAIECPWWIAPIIAMFIGFIKEIIDLLNKNKRFFDWKDILADLIGTGAITLFYVFGKLL